MCDPDQHLNKVGFGTTVQERFHYDSIKLSTIQTGNLGGCCLPTFSIIYFSFTDVAVGVATIFFRLSLQCEFVACKKYCKTEGPTRHIVVLTLRDSGPS